MRDGWGVLNLARRSDEDLLEAFTAGSVCFANEGLSDWMAAQDSAAILDLATDLGLAYAPVPRVMPLAPDIPWTFRPSGSSLSGRGIVNLAGLWAGPLAGRILSDLGQPLTHLTTPARQPESSPPWARSFDSWLRQGQACLVIDDLRDDIAHEILSKAQVVITGARLQGLVRAGIAPRPDQLWVQITAYGSTGRAAQRIGYGDDVGAAAGGLFWDKDGKPRFQGDAFPDPLTGVLSALAVLEAQRQGLGGVIAINLFDVAAWSLTERGLPR